MKPLRKPGTDSPRCATSPYNKTNDLNDDGQPYAHLTLGLESKDKLSSVDILQVRAGQNYLVEDFTRMQRLRADSVVLENLSRVARKSALTGCGPM